MLGTGAAMRAWTGLSSRRGEDATSSIEFRKPLRRSTGPALIVNIGVCGAAVVLASIAILDPEHYFLAGAALLVLAAGLAGFLFPWTCFGLIVGSLVLSPENFVQFSIGGVELRSLHRAVVLAAICLVIMRHGMARSSNAPMLALGGAVALTLVLSDIHPKLTLFQIIKSAFAFAVLFLFINVNYRVDVIPRLLRMIGLLPLVSIAGGIVVQLAHIESVHGGPWKVLPTEWTTGAMRLSGMNISPFLAYFAFTAFFVNLYEWLDSKKNWLLALAGVNFVIIVMTTTRTPIAAAMVLALCVLIFSGPRVLNLSTKLHLALAGALALGALLVFWWPTIEARFLRGAGTYGISVTGRDLIWEYFINAFLQNPWFGRGLGTGAVLLIGELEMTTAAHNEYLRLLTDIGIVGTAMFLGAIGWWIRSEIRFLDPGSRLLTLSFVGALALYSFTDNTLTASPALVAALALTLIFARGRYRAVEKSVPPSRAERPGFAPLQSTP